MGYSRKNPSPPTPMDGMLEILAGGGLRALEIWAEGGFEPKKSILGGHFQREPRFV